MHSVGVRQGFSGFFQYGIPQLLWLGMFWRNIGGGGSIFISLGFKDGVNSPERFFTLLCFISDLGMTIIGRIGVLFRRSTWLALVVSFWGAGHVDCPGKNHSINLFPGAIDFFKVILRRGLMCFCLFFRGRFFTLWVGVERDQRKTTITGLISIELIFGFVLPLALFRGGPKIPIGNSNR